VHQLVNKNFDNMKMQQQQQQQRGMYVEITVLNFSFHLFFVQVMTRTAFDTKCLSYHY
jgi:hypothetical protein